MLREWQCAFCCSFKKLEVGHSSSTSWSFISSFLWQDCFTSSLLCPQDLSAVLWASRSQPPASADSPVKQGKDFKTQIQHLAAILDGGKDDQWQLMWSFNLSLFYWQSLFPCLVLSYHYLLLTANHLSSTERKVADNKYSHIFLFIVSQYKENSKLLVCKMWIYNLMCKHKQKCKYMESGFETFMLFNVGAFKALINI